MAKHNKLKNSGLLFELLVRQITTDTLNNNKDSEAIKILKKYFYNTDLLKEYKIYNTIATTRNKSEVKADALLNACTEAYKKLNKQNLRKQKYDLIAEIKSHYNLEEFFKAKVDNYKVLASIYQLLEMHEAPSFDAKVYMSCKETLIEHVSTKKVTNEDADMKEFATLGPGTRSLVYNIAHKNFEDKYAGLNESQKNLLKAYINNISTTDNLRSYCNEQIKYIKEAVSKMVNTINDEVRCIKLTEISKSLEEIPLSKTVSDADVTTILQYFSLIEEYNNIHETAN